MKIYIPTRGRPLKQRTAETLIKAGIPFTMVCTDGDDMLDEYRRHYGKKVLIVEAENVTEKRQAILDRAKDKLLMLDDDLSFYIRRKDASFRIAEPEDIGKIITWFDKALDVYAHAGLVDKFMCNTRPRGCVLTGRYNQALGYNKKLFPKPLPSFRTVTNQEHDMHLQLLSAGCRPLISCEYSKDAKYYSDGGCSAYRTPQVERRVFKQLKALWPDYVKLRDSEHSIGGVAATFNWRRAYKDSDRADNYITMKQDQLRMLK